MANNTFSRLLLHHLQLLLNRLEPIITIHQLHSIRKDWQLSALKISQPSTLISGLWLKI
jgi:hypothetical protein